MALDACVSFGVVIGGLIILWKSWMWIDPLISFVVIRVVMISSWKLFKESLNLMLMAVPTNLDLDSLSKIFVGIKGIINYHDLHVWPISTTETALSAHLVVMAESLFVVLFCLFLVYYLFICLCLFVKNKLNKNSLFRM